MHDNGVTRRLASRVLEAAALVLAALLAHRAAAQAQQFYSVTPCRAVDTRNGYGFIVSASTIRTFTIKGVCGIPSDAKSVAMNATVIGPTVDGFIFIWPNNGGPLPSVSNMNFTAGTPALANGVVVGLYATTPDLAMAYGSNTGSGTLHLVLDVTGYFK